MPLSPGIFPQKAQILMCDFGPEPDKIVPPGIMKGPLGVAPEMYKVRHAVVVSGSRGLTMVVPFSTVAPKTPQKYHYCIPAGTYPFFDPHEDNWAKSDMLTTVSNDRLDRPYVGGAFATVRLSPDDFKRICETVLHALGLSRLTTAL